MSRCKAICRKLGAQALAAVANKAGGVATTFALAIPVIAVIAIGAIELTGLSADRAEMQAAADNAALAGAKELTVSSPDSVVERGKAFVLSQLGPTMTNYELSASGRVDSDPATLTVEVTAHRMSFFGNLLPPGGFTLKVRSTAANMGTAPLCVLSHGVSKALLNVAGLKVAPGPNGAGILIQENARVNAPQCLVQSNDDLTVSNGARLYAAISRAGGLVRGPISPAGESSAPLIDDPFADYDLSIPSSCPSEKIPRVKVSGSETLPAGVHCGGIELEQTAVMTLAPGEHYFIGDVKVRDSAQMTGSDVVLIFDKDSKFEFKDHSRISLGGRKTGNLAGFVVITTRSNTRDFRIDSGRVEALLGTIYIPEAQLIIEGSQTVADKSDWTVIIAQQLALKGSPNLVINANYATSNVPVPVGVGPSKGVQLVR